MAYRSTINRVDGQSAASGAAFRSMQTNRIGTSNVAARTDRLQNDFSTSVDNLADRDGLLREIQERRQQLDDLEESDASQNREILSAVKEAVQSDPNLGVNIWTELGGDEGPQMIQDLKDSLAELEEKIEAQASSGDLAAWQSEKVGLEQRIADLEKELEEAKEGQKMASRKPLAQPADAMLRSKIEDLENELAEKTQKLSEVEKEARELNLASLDEAEEIAALSGDKRRLDGEVAKLKLDLGKVRQERDASIRRTASLNAGRSDLTSRNKKLQEEANKEKVSRIETEEKLAQVVKKHRAEKVEALRLATVANENFVGLTADHQEEHQRADNAEALVESYRHNVYNLGLTNDRVEEARQQLASEVLLEKNRADQAEESLKEEVAYRQAEQSAHVNVVQATTAIARALVVENNKVAEAEKERVLAGASLAETKVKLGHVQEKFSRSVDVRNRKIRESKTVEQSLRGEIIEFIAKLTKCEEQVQSLGMELESAQTSATKLGQDLERVQQENKALRKRNAELVASSFRLAVQNDMKRRKLHDLSVCGAKHSNVEWKGGEWLSRIPGMNGEGTKEDIAAKLERKEKISLSELVKFVETSDSCNLGLVENYLEHATGLIRARCLELLGMHGYEVVGETPLEMDLLEGKVPEGLSFFKEGIILDGKWHYAGQLEFTQRFVQRFLVVEGKTVALPLKKALEAREVGLI